MIDPLLEWTQDDQSILLKFLRSQTGLRLLANLREKIRPKNTSVAAMIQTDAVAIIGAMAAARYEGQDTVIDMIEKFAIPQKPKQNVDIGPGFDHYNPNPTQ